MKPEISSKFEMIYMFLSLDFFFFVSFVRISSIVFEEATKPR